MRRFHFRGLGYRRQLMRMVRSRSLLEVLRMREKFCLLREVEPTLAKAVSDN